MEPFSVLRLLSRTLDCITQPTISPTLPSPRPANGGLSTRWLFPTLSVWCWAAGEASSEYVRAMETMGPLSSSSLAGYLCAEGPALAPPTLIILCPTREHRPQISVLSVFVVIFLLFFFSTSLSKVVAQLIRFYLFFVTFIDLCDFFHIYQLRGTSNPPLNSYSHSPVFLFIYIFYLIVNLILFISNIDRDK